jgi:hypothetical protein
VKLTADPGVLVRLEAFDVGNFGGPITIPAIRVLDHNGQPLFAQTNYVLGASGGPHSSFTFSPALMDSSLTIDFDLTGLGGNSDNVGLDNVRFGQDVPEPSFGLLLPCGMIFLARRRRGGVA